MDIERLANIAPWEWPEEAHDEILAALRDKRGSVDRRTLAVQLAGEHVVIDDLLAAELLSIVSSGDEFDDVRASAAIALGPALEQADVSGFDDEDDILVTEEMFGRARAELRRVFEDARTPKEVRRRVLEGAVRAPEEWQAQAIRDAWASDDPEWKLTAMFGMGYVPGFDDQILDALESDDPELQFQALRAAGSQGVAEAWPFVEGILDAGDPDNEEDKELLLVAIDAVPSIRPQDADSVLGDLLESEDEDVVAAVHEALAMAHGMNDLDLDEEDTGEGPEDDDEEEPADDDEGGGKR
jgi:hypothetical protein